MTVFDYRREGSVAVLTYDTPGPVNVLATRYFADIREGLTRVARDGAVKAAVVVSGKPDGFVAGADLHEFLGMTDRKQGEAFSREGQSMLRMMSSSAKPYVAAVHGAALGGGLEVALHCTYRLATEHPRTVFALPEVMLGLVPGGGGTQLVHRLVGLRRALPLLLTGQRLHARRAHRHGLVDALTSPGGLVDTAVRAARMLADGKLAVRRRTPLADSLLALPLVRSVVLARARRDVVRRTRGFYPAPLCILDCVATGFAKGEAAGLERESHLFGQLVVSSDARNLIRLFDAGNDLKKLPETPVPRPVTRVAVLGAGLMGEGIASVSLGLNPVVLRDVSEEALTKAAKSLHRGLHRRVRSGALSRIERDRQWFGLHPTTRAVDAGGADLVIEAVYEELELKRSVLAEIEGVLAPDAVFASNTSAIPISEIAAQAAHPERVVGMHYFSPVPKRPLVEIAASRRTSDRAVATARAYAVAQGKTPIVVKDGPGFFTTRILAPFLNEAVLLLEEGAEVRALDAALVGFGLLIGPAGLLDEVGLDVGARVTLGLGPHFEKRGFAFSATLPRLHSEGFLGKKNRRGFYVYRSPDERRRREVNEEIYAFFGGPRRREMPAREMAERVTLAMVNEAVHCLAEGVISSPRDGDVGAVLGLGFPPFRGGPFRYADGLSASAVVARLNRLAETAGARFAPAPLLVEMAKDERVFYSQEARR